MIDETPKPATGWVCPLCKRALAPTVKVCPCSLPEARTALSKVTRLDYRAS